MQSLLREKLLTEASKLATVSTIYHTESHRFVSAYFTWLIDAEKELAALRSPLGILLQSEKTALVSVLDGNVPANVGTMRSVRKSQRAVAAQSLERISKEIYAKIEAIDGSLDPVREKLSAVVAMLALREPVVFKRLQPNPEGILVVWRQLRETAETSSMYHYLSARLTSVDRDYLLMDILQNMAANRNGV